MRQQEAQRLILAKFDRWVKEKGISNPKTFDAFTFCSELSERADPALDFQCTGDKWQHVKAWLVRAKKVRMGL